MKENELIKTKFGDFLILEEMTCGGIGCIFKAVDEKGGLYAIKTLIRKEEEEEIIKRFIHECNIAHFIKHPNIAKCYGVDRSEDGEIFLILEFVKGKNLVDLMDENYEEISLRDCLNIIYEVAKVIHHLKDNFIIHRDIKAENIIVSEKGEVKVVDFGYALSPYLDFEEGNDRFYGTVKYIPPEAIMEGYSLDEEGFKHDVFSLGVLFYLLIEDRFPFDGETEEEIIDNTVEGYPEEITSIRNKKVLYLIYSMLEKYPENRISIEGVVSALEELL